MLSHYLQHVQVCRGDGSAVYTGSLQDPPLDLVSETEFTLRMSLSSVRRPGRSRASLLECGVEKTLHVIVLLSDRFLIYTIV